MKNTCANWGCRDHLPSIFSLCLSGVWGWIKDAIVIINNLLDNSQVRYKHDNYIIYLGFFFHFFLTLCCRMEFWPGTKWNSSDGLKTYRRDEQKYLCWFLLALNVTESFSCREKVKLNWKNKEFVICMEYTSKFSQKIDRENPLLFWNINFWEIFFGKLDNYKGLWLSD